MWLYGGVFEEIQTAEEYSNFLAARYAGMAGEPAAAAGFYREAFDRQPDDPVLLERAVFSSMIAGQVGEAIAVSTGADPQTSTGSPSAQLALVVDDIVSNRTRRALLRLKTSGLGAINADLSGFLAAWLTAAEDPDAGLGVLDQLPPRRLLAGEQACMKGLILLSAGREDDALEAFEQAARLPLGSSSFLTSLRARLLAAKDPASARKLIATQVEETGATPETDYVLHLLEAGKTIEPPRLTVRQGAAIAVYLASAGGIARSSPELATMRQSLALHLDPALAPARLMLADALNEQGRTEDAIAALQEIPADSEWSASARLQQAWFYDRLERPVEALAAADQALSLSRRRDVLVGAADLYRINQNYPKAEALYGEIIRADMGAKRPDWRVLFARASAREASGNWTGAEADALAALAIEPDRPEVQNFLGYGWVNRGEKVKEGMDLIRKAVASRPDQGYMVDSLGWAHYRLGEYAAAVEQLERAAELSPSDSDIVDHLGDAYWRAGRHVEASFEWRRALELKPKPQRETALREKLDRGLPPVPSGNLASAQQGTP
jgi:tetratricopeptide (TPR) repeat protein